MDSREQPYILARPDDFASDLDLLRRRHDELRYAPPLHDGERFPNRAAINEMLSFNRAYRERVELRLPLDLPQRAELRETVQETDRLYKVWDTVRDAQVGYYYVTVRRQALAKLREMVGPEAYFAGTLPPCVPAWRFRRIGE